MTYVVYTSDDIASSSMAAALKDEMGFKAANDIQGHRHFVADDVHMLEVSGHLYDAEYINELLDTDMLVFLSRHASEKGIASFTTHSLGNWSAEARYGGRPKCLSVAAPGMMLKVLQSMNRHNTTGVPVTYEATHHGPLLDTPALFVELGGDETILGDKGLAAIAARSVASALRSDAECGRAAIGIGGTHYPDKFTRLAIDGRYAFSHIMSRHYVDNIDMIEDAIERSDKRAEIAVIEWKSIKAADRESVIGRLDVLGIGYERV